MLKGSLAIISWRGGEGTPLKRHLRMNKKSHIMKPFFFPFAIALIFCLHAASQPVVQMPSTFDVARENIPHGKIDTISYASKTVGTTRRALIYTPPGYSKKKRY